MQKNKIISQETNDHEQSKIAMGYDAARIHWSAQELKKRIMLSYVKMLKKFVLRRLKYIEYLRKLKMSGLFRVRKQVKSCPKNTEHSNTQHHYFDKKTIMGFALNSHLTYLAGSSSFAFRLIALHYQQYLRKGKGSHPDFYLHIERACIQNLKILLSQKELSDLDYQLATHEVYAFCQPLHENQQALKEKQQFFSNFSGSKHNTWLAYLQTFKSIAPPVHLDAKMRPVMPHDLQRAIHAKAKDQGLRKYFQLNQNPLSRLYHVSQKQPILSVQPYDFRPYAVPSMQLKPTSSSQAKTNQCHSQENTGPSLKPLWAQVPSERMSHAHHNNSAPGA